jgi:hypothetical protein
MKDNYNKQKFISLLLNRLDQWQLIHPNEIPFVSIKIFPRSKIKTKKEIDISELSTEGIDRVKILKNEVRRKKTLIHYEKKDKNNDVERKIEDIKDSKYGLKQKGFTRTIIRNEYDVVKVDEEVVDIEDGALKNLYCQIDMEDTDLRTCYKIESTESILKSTCTLFADVEPIINEIDGTTLYGGSGDGIINDVLIGLLPSTILGSIPVQIKNQSTTEISTQTDLTLPSAMFESPDLLDLTIPFSIRDLQQFTIMNVNITVESSELINKVREKKEKNTNLSNSDDDAYDNMDNESESNGDDDFDDYG